MGTGTNTLCVHVMHVVHVVCVLLQCLASGCCSAFQLVVEAGPGGCTAPAVSACCM